MTYTELKTKHSFLSKERDKLRMPRDKNRYLKLTEEMMDVKRELQMFERVMRDYENKIRRDAGIK